MHRTMPRCWFLSHGRSRSSFGIAPSTALILAHTYSHLQALIDSWFPLWQWVFQPAIGTLMLGALVSGAVGQLQKGADKGT